MEVRGQLAGTDSVFLLIQCWLQESNSGPHPWQEVRFPIKPSC